VLCGAHLKPPLSIGGHHRDGRTRTTLLHINVKIVREFGASLHSSMAFYRMFGGGSTLWWQPGRLC
jgi:hypothetical protein